MSIHNDTHETLVIFRVWPNGEVTALFPALAGNGDALGREVLAYEQRGGEQSYDYDRVMTATYAAEPKEYRALARIIIARYGYNLRVVSYAPAAVHQRRRSDAMEAWRERRRSHLVATTVGGS
jgi:hypothetical protein